MIYTAERPTLPDHFETILTFLGTSSEKLKLIRTLLFSQSLEIKKKTKKTKLLRENQYKTLGTRQKR